MAEIFFTSDTHSYVFPTDYTSKGRKDMGYIAMSSAFSRDAIIVDGGDVLQGSPLVRCEMQGGLRPFTAAEAFNRAGLSVYVPGNHDFDFGYDVLRSFLSELKADAVAANVIDERGELGIKPYVLKEASDGLRILFVGVVTDYVNIWESAEKLRAAADSRKAEAAAREKDIIRFPVFETTEGYASLSADIKALKDALRGFGDTLDEARRTMKERIKAIDDEADRIQRKLQDFEKKREQEKRIKEIRARAKELKELIEDAEKGIELADSFIRRRAELLDQKVSSLFTGVRFRLYDTQVNGVIKELCEPLVETRNGWIPYTQASNAEKISGGLRIISMLSDHIDKEMPVVIDNAEAVIALPRIKSQTIRLAVSDEKTGSMRFEIG